LDLLDFFWGNKYDKRPTPAKYAAKVDAQVINGCNRS
jgi:hypothetical protein